MTIHEWVAKMLRHRTVLAEKILMLASELWSAEGSSPMLERSADAQSRGAALPNRNSRAERVMGVATRTTNHSSDNFNAYENIIEKRGE